MRAMQPGTFITHSARWHVGGKRERFIDNLLRWFTSWFMIPTLNIFSSSSFCLKYTLLAFKMFRRWIEKWWKQIQFWEDWNWKIEIDGPLSDDPKPINWAGDLLSSVPMFVQTPDYNASKSGFWWEGGLRICTRNRETNTNLTHVDDDDDESNLHADGV